MTMLPLLERFIRKAILFLTSLVLLIACGEKEPPAIEVISVTLDKTTVHLMEGEKESLTVKVNPATISDKSVKWSSSNESVAIISNRYIIALKAGTAIITAEVGGKSASCTVSVTPAPVEVTSLVLTPTTVSMMVGETVKITAEVLPDDAVDKTVTWNTSNETVVAVNDGVVTALKVGTATITARAGDMMASCEISVLAPPVESITLDVSSVRLKIGESVTLTAKVSPDDAGDKTVTWTSSDESVATVTDGVVVAVKNGSAVIRAKAGTKTASCIVFVDAISVTGITLDKTSVVLSVDQEVVLTATVTPSNATYKSVTWSSDNKAVATVKDGKIKAIAPGKCNITASTASGAHKAICAVTVKSGGLDAGIGEWENGGSLGGDAD